MYINLQLLLGEISGRLPELADPVQSAPYHRNYVDCKRIFLLFYLRFCFLSLQLRPPKGNTF